MIKCKVEFYGITFIGTSKVLFGMTAVMPLFY